MRDNYRCQLTGRFDTKSYRNRPATRKAAAANPTAGLGSTECHHIIPRFIGQQIDDLPRPDNTSTVWSIIETYGGISHTELIGQNIHELRNIMTLRADIRNSFDKLEIWLEPVEGADNVYNIGRFDPLICPELPTTVTFATDTGLPLPDPRYLALHAACAKVVLKSGAAESIDSILRDTEETKVLSQDGSSEGLLNALLYEHTHAWAKI
ncbi:unnamed protein product [Rhizoctonia solani]|uniref:HNH nuclease domain-containing protein n=1 Tax=Rhizoctonia solani TaxID=456999 RepID=A0A8H3CME4_9AGAM|nr:unnamed protein product [Rhizoctonia solani]